MEPIRLNIATFENFNKRLFRLMLGVLGVIIGIAGCIDIYLYLHHRSTVAAYQLKVDQLMQNLEERKMVGTRTPGGLSKAEKEAVRQQVEAINTLILKDIFPWPRVLDILEAHLPENMLFERISHSQDYKTLVLMGAAETPDAVASFMDHLNQDSFFKKNRLASLTVETKSFSADRAFKGNIKFEIECEMNVNDLLTGMGVQ